MEFNLYDSLDVKKHTKTWQKYPKCLTGRSVFVKVTQVTKFDDVKKLLRIRPVISTSGD